MVIRICIVGVFGEGENLSSECWAKVQGHFWIHPNNLSRRLLAHGRSGLLGFGKDESIRNSGGWKKKPFQFLRERRWRRLNFLGWLPRARLMKNRDRRRPRRSSLWKVTGRQSSGGARTRTIRSFGGCGLTHSTGVDLGWDPAVRMDTGLGDQQLPR